MPALTTVYFDGSISVTDANNAWTNDANAFNGNTTTFATAGGTQSPTSGALVGAGTSGSISSGSTILSVRARLYGGSPTTRTWGSWVTLTAPTGGWTSANIKSLETRIYGDLTPSLTTRVKARITTAGNAENLGTVEAGTDSSNTPDGGNVGRVEIEVSTDTGQRYLRATGNWNGAVWADTSGGTAGSAATPTASDPVYIAANFTVTLTEDASCDRLEHTNGTISLSSYKLTVSNNQAGSFQSTGNNARTINMGSGTIHVKETASWASVWSLFVLSGSNLTFNAGTSLLQIDYIGSPADLPDGALFATGSKTFNDVRINLSGEYPRPLSITGSPTFRSLVIQSKNSAAHTVNFDSPFYTSKFIAIGSSTTNRLTIGGDAGFFIFADKTDTYGQFVDMQLIDYSADRATHYIGSNSVQVGGGGWLLQDPPKISTLVDQFTGSALSSLWGQTSSGSTQFITVSGGQLHTGWMAGTAYIQVYTTGTYDLVDSAAYVDVASITGETQHLSVSGIPQAGNPSSSVSASVTSAGLYRFKGVLSGSNVIITAEIMSSGSWSTLSSTTVPQEMARSVRLSISGTRNSAPSTMVINRVGTEITPPSANFLLFFLGGE